MPPDLARSSDGKIRAWLRLDGWTEIEWPGGCTRYKTHAEVDAFVAGMKVILALITKEIDRATSGIDIVDDRPIRPPPRDG